MQDHHHHRAVLSKLLDFHQRGQFSDVTIQLLDDTVGASRALVAALSPVMEAMLATDMAESRTGIVRLKGCKRTWDLTVQFYCSSEVKIQEEDVEDVLRFAHMYQLLALTHQCDAILPSMVRPDNAVSLVTLAVELSLTDSSKALQRYIAENFVDVSKGEDFVYLDKNVLADLLKSNEVVATEEYLCVKLLDWLEANREKSVSETTAADLCSCLRLWKMTSEFLQQQVLAHKRVLCNGAIQQAMERELKQRETSLWSPGIPDSPQKRGWPTPPHHLLLLGTDANYKKHLLSWSPGGRQWKSIPLEHSFCQPLAVVVGDEILVLDRKPCDVNFPGETLKSFLFHLELKTWLEGPALSEKFYLRGLVGIAGRAFVVGSEHHKDACTTIQEFDTKTRKWIPIGKLRLPVFNCSVLALRNCVVVVGEVAREENDVREMDDVIQTDDVIQAFDVTTKMTTVLKASLPLCVVGFKTAVHGDVGVFLGRNGDMIKVRLTEEMQLQVDPSCRLQGFQDKTALGLYLDGSRLWVLGGLHRVDSSEASQRQERSIHREGRIRQEGNMQQERSTRNDIMHQQRSMQQEGSKRQDGSMLQGGSIRDGSIQQEGSIHQEGSIRQESRMHQEGSVRDGGMHCTGSTEQERSGCPTVNGPGSPSVLKYCSCTRCYSLQGHLLEQDVILPLPVGLKVDAVLNLRL